MQGSPEWAGLWFPELPIPGLPRFACGSSGDAVIGDEVFAGWRARVTQRTAASSEF